jgi:hypothetical protein
MVLQSRHHNQTHRTFEIKAQCPEGHFRSLEGHVYLQLNILTKALKFKEVSVSNFDMRFFRDTREA